MGPSVGYAHIVKGIEIEGNAKVESDAVLNLLNTKIGNRLDKATIQQDIRDLYELGYFSDIRFFKRRTANEVILIIRVVEKPAITSIEFKGLDELKEDDIKKSMETSLFTIVNDGSITADMRLIEKKYAEKGFYLAKVNYTLEPQGKNEVALTFHVDERGKVLVGEVNLLGNLFFSDGALIEKFMSRPYTRWSATLGAASLFQDDFLKRDLEFLSYYYKDFGFAEIKVGKPDAQMDPDKRFVRITIELEEGLQYKVGSLKISGDVDGLYSEEELLEKMQLLPKNLFRYSHFTKDIEMLVDKYGDLGYAYVDVNPLTRFDKEKREVHIDYRITKGKKVYFGEINIIGNTKTRDNVIRRELEVFDSELYSGTHLSESKKNVNRLGFFEEVQVLKERDEDVDDILNLNFKVKEKPTGQLQAAVGFSPQGRQKQSWFGQGRYDEKNQSGRGWNLNLTGKYGDKKNWEIDTGFYDPHVNDSEWSFGFNLSYKIQEVKYTTADVLENHRSISTRVGRSLFELVRGTVGLKHTKIFQVGERADSYLLDSNRTVGVKNSFSLGLIRRDLDNYLDPSEGTDFGLSHKFTGGALGGNYTFMESTVNAEYYIPLNFTETYRTYFKVKGYLGKLWSSKNQSLPASERYRLGYYDLRGYKFATIGPKDRRALGPQGSFIDYNVGGDKQLYFQFEYFMPLIPEAGIKALVFADMGQVYHEEQAYSLDLKQYQKDVGFGFRWLTPIAPFRFEWAYPYDEETKSFGDLNFIFNIGF